MEGIYLVIGLLIGFYAQRVYTYIKNIYDMLKEKSEYSKAGVVKPEITRGNTRKRPQEIDLTTSGGVIRRPTPDEILLNRMKERNENIKRGDYGNGSMR